MKRQSPLHQRGDCFHKISGQFNMPFFLSNRFHGDLSAFCEGRLEVGFDLGDTIDAI